MSSKGRSESWEYPCPNTIPNATVLFRESAHAPIVCRPPGPRHGCCRHSHIRPVRSVARGFIAEVEYRMPSHHRASPEPDPRAAADDLAGAFAPAALGIEAS